MNEVGVLKLKRASVSPGELLKHRGLGPTPRISDLVGEGCSPRTSISSRFSGEASTTAPGNTR